MNISVPVQKRLVFISYSQDFAFHHGCLIRQFILDNSDDYEVFLGGESIKSDKNWMDTIIAKVADAEIFISLLDDAYFSSFWASFEYGLSQTKAKGKVILVQIASNDSVSIHHHIKQRQVRMDFRSFLCELRNELTFRRMTAATLDLRFANLLVSFAEILTNIEFAGAREKRDSLLHCLEIRRTSLAIIDGNNERRTLMNQQIQQHGRSTILELEIIYSSAAINFLKFCMETLEKMEHGTIDIRVPEFAKIFWRKELLTKVKKSIWTTNLNGTNGRSTEREYIDPQLALVLNNVRITRVFVFDHKSIPEMKSLVNTINTFLDEIPEIRMMVIPKTEYKKLGPRRGRIPLKEDFMIIDDKFVWETDLDEDTERVIWGSVFSTEKNIDVVVDFSMTVEGKSRLVTTKIHLSDLQSMIIPNKKL